MFDNAAGHPRRGPVSLFSEQQHSDWRNTALAIEPAIGDAVIGQQPLIRLINIALFARGHVLLEGDVGVGKTTVLRAFARALGGEITQCNSQMGFADTAGAEQYDIFLALGETGCQF